MQSWHSQILPFLHFCSCLNSLIRPSSTLFSRIEENRYHSLSCSWCFWESVYYSIIKYYLSHGVFRVYPFRLRTFLSIPVLLNVLCFFKSQLSIDLLKCFFCFYWSDHTGFLLYSVKVVHYIYWYLNVKSTLPFLELILFGGYCPFYILLGLIG